MSIAQDANQLLPGTERNGSIQRAFLLLNALASQPDGASVATLSTETSLPRSTVVRLLASLADAGAVARPDQNRKWILGPTISRLTHTALPEPNLGDRCRPLLEEVTAKLKETSLAAVPIGPMSARVICEIEGPRMVGVRSSWAETTITDPSAGFVRMLLAEMPAKTVTTAVEQLQITQHTHATKATPGLLLAEIEKIKRDGFSLVVDELEVGLSGVAVPVRNNGIMIAMLSTYLPTTRLTSTFIDQACTALNFAADQLGTH